MPQYLRAFIPGGTFFFTVMLLERRRKLLTENIDNIREVFQDGPSTSRPGHFPRSPALYLDAAFHRYVRCGIHHLEWTTDDYDSRLEMR